MSIYILYFLFIAVLAIQYEFKPFRTEIYLSVIVLGLVFLTAFQGPYVTIDHSNYINSYDYIEELMAKAEKGSYLAFYEPGFIALILIAKKFFISNYALVIALMIGFFAVLLKIFRINQTPVNPFICILFYFSQYYILQDMTELRIGLASAIFLASLSYYFKGNYFAYSICILIAGLFHYSAFFYLIILFFNKNTFNRYIYAGLLVLAIILAFIKLPLINLLGNFDVGSISKKISVYTEVIQRGLAEDIHVLNVVNIFSILTCIYFIFFIPKSILLADKKLLFYLKCNILAIFLLSFLSGVPTIAFRFSELFGIVSTFVFAYLCN
jgi:hypothetical protein